MNDQGSDPTVKQLKNALEALKIPKDLIKPLTQLSKRQQLHDDDKAEKANIKKACVSVPRGVVEFYKLPSGKVYTANSPVQIPVAKANVKPGEESCRLVFSCPAESDAKNLQPVDKGVVVLLPAGVADQTIFRVEPNDSVTVHVDPELAKVRMAIPYQVYFDERDQGEADDENLKHGYAESNSPPAMHIGP
jgi:hypothetical protein